MSQFEEWYQENEDLLSTHDVPRHVAEIIWDSAKVSVLHNVANAIQEGSIKLNISLE